MLHRERWDQTEGDSIQSLRLSTGVLAGRLNAELGSNSHLWYFRGLGLTPSDEKDMPRGANNRVDSGFAGG